VSGSDAFHPRELFQALAPLVTIAHRDDLLKMKRASGRPQDLADVRLLEALDDEP
jgi:hypothetical protein